MGARDLLAELSDSGFSVTAEGGRLVIRPASKLTDTQRDALRRAKSELLALLSARGRAGGPVDMAAAAWTEGDIANFLARRARMLRWGWAEQDAEAMAERLVNRDRARDDRVSCTECHNYRPGRCSNHRRADLMAPDLGRDMAALLQRCPGFAVTCWSKEKAR